MSRGAAGGSTAREPAVSDTATLLVAARLHHCSHTAPTPHCAHPHPHGSGGVPACDCTSTRISEMIHMAWTLFGAGAHWRGRRSVTRWSSSPRRFLQYGRRCSSHSAACHSAACLAHTVLPGTHTCDSRLLVQYVRSLTVGPCGGRGVWRCCYTIGSPATDQNHLGFDQRLSLIGMTAAAWVCTTGGWATWWQAALARSLAR